VDSRSVVDPDDIRRAIRPDTKLISVMHANNETGMLQPVEEVAKIAARAGIPFHVDGVQAAGKGVRMSTKLIDYYAISSHKLGGPKGIGALIVRKDAPLAPILLGGSHERSRRAGTENVPAAVGFGTAALLGRPSPAPLRDFIEQAVLERIPDAHVNGAGAPRINNTTNLRFDGIDSDALLIALDLRGFAVSSGAACSSGSPEPSHVLLAMGLTKLQARSSIRISLGWGNTQEQAELLVDALVASVAHLRKLSPTYA
jgi:cysteine desulfurase